MNVRKLVRSYWSDKYRRHWSSKHNGMILLIDKNLSLWLPSGQESNIRHYRIQLFLSYLFSLRRTLFDAQVVSPSVPPAEFVVVKNSFSCVVQDYVFVHCNYKCYGFVRFSLRSEVCVCVCVCVCIHTPYLHLFFVCTLVPAQRIDVFYYYLPLLGLLCVYSFTFYCVVCLHGLAGHVVLSALCGAYNHRAAYINQAID